MEQGSRGEREEVPSIEKNSCLGNKSEQRPGKQLPLRQTAKEGEEKP